MAISTEQAKALKPGDMLHHVAHKNSDGTPQRWKVNGQPKVWKTRPLDVEVPVKHGMYSYDRLVQKGWKDEQGEWHLSYSDLELVNMGEGR